MEVIFENKNSIVPEVSIVLLDWSCREGMYILEYLNNQIMPRQQYEVIWIEYYKKRSVFIEEQLKDAERLNKPPIVDKWIIMGMTEQVYYHKHLMYNIGIITSRGRILTICDSDAIVMPTFVDTIVKSFGAGKDIVLHIDEVRNISKRYYPFNYPSRGEILAEGCINYRDGKTTGVIDEVDPLHTRNYGACMCALREDLVKIGGADEDISYLGHICGPYEMTFRLVNAGKKEVWHQSEFIYHTWHPGTDGHDNYLGPHDGKNMSTTALEVRSTSRIMPLVENPAIKNLRMGEDEIIYTSLLSQAIPELEVLKWDPLKIKQDSKKRVQALIMLYKDFRNRPLPFIKDLSFCLVLFKEIFIIIFQQIQHKIKDNIGNGEKVIKKSLIFNIKMTYTFFNRMFKNNLYSIKLCESALKRLVLNGEKEVVIYGNGFISKILCMLADRMPLKVTGIYDKKVCNDAKERLFGHQILPLEYLARYKGKVVIASLSYVLEKTTELKEVGVNQENIVRLQ